jgi:hypothetical protein
VSFFGIKPESKYWPDAVKALDDYRHDICTASRNSMTWVWQNIYKNLSEKEMQQDIDFYNSPAGRKITDSTVKADNVFENGQGKESLDREIGKAQMEYRMRMRDLACMQKLDCARNKE